MDDVNNIMDLCEALKKKGIINFGEYSKLREILVTRDVKAGKIIDKYEERVRREKEGNTQSEPLKQWKGIGGNVEQFSSGCRLKDWNSHGVLRMCSYFKRSWHGDKYSSN
ncbi:hypothetical protein KP79_PYT22746 [Mizuhopecten yessoensis]|uniref:SWIRM domain-containing protein n=2 Tax=Mizuhopecten yessoensis TaxID=6573 RepID=A0A210PN79_MIZYE|nr:hypothetical protein KP79_PYT22746 [Mizuhopecten yessoensis]